MTTTNPARLGTAPDVILLGHAVLVAVLSVLFVRAMSVDVGGANIGAGLILIQLWPLGLPWSLLDVGAFGAVLVLGAVGNVVLHAALYRRRRSRVVLLVTAAVLAVPLTVAAVATVHSREAKADLRAQARALTPVALWPRPTVEEPDCAFCTTQGIYLRSDRTVSSDVTEDRLLAAVKAPPAAAGYRPDGDWDCGPQQTTRICSRDWSDPGHRFFAVVTIPADGRPDLWLEVVRD